MKYPVAALYVDHNGPYPSIADEWWDIEKDARFYPGPRPVVAHPPCRAWSRLRSFSKPPPGEKETGPLAVSQVRRFGGVLEHPIGSSLFPYCGLPGSGSSDSYGFTLAVDQVWFGHRARKRTLLYIVGVEPRDIPPMPLDLRPPTHSCGLFSGRDRSRALKDLPKPERHLSPIGFATWLCELAAMAQTIQGPSTMSGSLYLPGQMLMDEQMGNS